MNQSQNIGNIETAGPAQLESWLYKLAWQTNKLEYEAVKAKEGFMILEDNKKIYFAEITKKQEAKTNAEKERLTLTTDHWKAWIKDYQIARSQWVKLEAEKIAKRRMWETVRSILSSKNSERRTNT